MEAEAERKEMARASLPGHWMLTAGRHVPDWGGGGGSRGGPWVVRQVEGKRRRACGARWWPYPASSRGRATPLADVAPPLARRTSPRKLPRFRVGKEMGRDQTASQLNAHHCEFARSDGQRANGRRGPIR
jgi:hypothetical protein